jgi:Xaa-Pro aminopeptidase
MTDSELDWLDNYHREIVDKVSPLLDADSPGLAWLTKACEKINRTI